MSVTQMIWSLDNKEQLKKEKLQSELELENLLAAHIEILDPNWLLLGRQIKTVSGKYILCRESILICYAWIIVETSSLWN